MGTAEKSVSKEAEEMAQLLTARVIRAGARVLFSAGAVSDHLGNETLIMRNGLLIGYCDITGNTVDPRPEATNYVRVDPELHDGLIDTRPHIICINALRTGSEAISLVEEVEELVIAELPLPQESHLRVVAA